MPQIVITLNWPLLILSACGIFLVEKNAEAAQNVGRALSQAIDRLAHNPYLGRELDNDIRVLTVKFAKYGYQIAYRYDEKVYILAMRSGREDSFRNLF